MSDPFKELEEELRHERLLNLWKTYGPWLIGLVVAVILGVGGYQLWTYLERQDRQADSASLISAAAPLENQNYKAAIKALTELRPELEGDMAALARFREAEARLGVADETGAVAALNSVAGDSGVSQTFRDLAVVQAAALEMDSASYDELRARLTPLTQTDNMWRFSARELLGFAAMRAERPEAARQQFERISAASDAPAAFRRRAEQMLSLLGPASQGAGASKAADKPTGGETAAEPTGEESQ